MSVRLSLSTIFQRERKPALLFGCVLAVLFSVGACRLKAPNEATGQSASAFIAQAEAAIDKGDRATAEKNARAALKADPNSLEARLLLVRVLGPTSQETVELLKQIIALNPQRPEGYALLADALLRQGRAKEAQAAAQKGADLGGGAPLYVMLGMAAMLQNDPGTARGAFATAIELAPRALQPRLFLAEACLALGDTEGAAAAYFDVLALDPQEPTARIGLAELFLLQGAALEAIDLLEGARWKEKPDAGYFGTLGDAYLAAERPLEAAGAFELASQKAPEKAEYHAKTGQALLQAGELKEGADVLEAARKKWPKDLNILASYAYALVALNDPKAPEALQALQAVSPKGDLATLSLRAEQAIQQKDYNSAASILEEAATANPSVIDPLLRLGDVQALAGKPEEAAKAYERARSLNPKDPRAGMATAELFAKSDPKRALDAVDEVLAKNPELVEALLTRAQLLIEVNRFSDAVKTFEEALSLRPDSETVNNNFAWALVYEAKPAEKDCQRGLRLAQKALELSAGKSAAVLDTLAEAHRCNGDYEQALDAMDKAQALQPDSAFYQKHRAEIEAERQKNPKKKTKNKKGS